MVIGYVWITNAIGEVLLSGIGWAAGILIRALIEQYKRMVIR